VGFKTPRNTREVRGLCNLLKIRGVPLCLIFGTKNSKHQGTPGVFGSAVFSWPEWNVIAEIHQYHCFMEHQRRNLNFASFSGVYKVNGTVNG
jgi:hypothetical protein